MQKDLVVGPAWAYQLLGFPWCALGVPAGVICQVMLRDCCNMSPLFFASFAKFSNPEVTVHQVQKVADTLLIFLALQSW